MSRTSRRAFTLVELLVVITVIAMLMGLAFPALMSVLNNAKKTKCENNLSQIAKACQVYATNKGFLPPEVVDKYGKPPGKYMWPALLLGYLDRGDLGTNLQNGTGTWAVYMEVFVCPANQPDSQDGTWLAYAANAGQKNSGGSASMPADWRENGAFMPFLSNMMPSKVTPDFISTHDGLNTTLLLMETGRKDMTFNGAHAEGPATPNAIWSTTKQIAINEKSSGKFTGQIASTHPGGALVAMCSTSTKFLSEQVDTQVLDQIFTTFGAGAKNPGSATVTPQAGGVLPPAALDK